ncbi:hypothetical protein N0V93_001386 [Gnomoniopsis smithogilvyi]|uniref:Diphthine--ammonia ligase n=1 Tax=Gnomoniopsis smithogilvyi TaxID=1191159 RepID=A0A9W8Z1K5_9PEZI|nr:hypothetical protein N0V93_001386 [Gnomoniopsis smithogilvyi]
MASGSLNVIALVSGGKDSFFSALHCLENGHRLVALANLHPPPPKSFDDATTGGGHAGALASGHSSATSTAVGVGADTRAESGDADADLNSFMYQTVGHQVIPLYAEATGIPLYRRPIVGGAVHTERDYAAASGAGEADDETESMIPLLRSVIKAHPEANALSAGAILSTYQRTRVESVALRLGLTPLAYLWKYPILPAPLSAAEDEAQLLLDMATAGLDPRIIKVASGGLDESFLWENVASAKGVMRLKKAMGKFGSAGLDTGAVLGEGGEFETLVVDGPARLFRKRVVVADEDRLVVREGGGQAWLKVVGAKVVEKTTSEAQELEVRRPDALDERFAAVLSELKPGAENVDASFSSFTRANPPFALDPAARLQTWAVISQGASSSLTIQEETAHLVKEIQSRLVQQALSPSSIVSTAIILRSMADFPAINAIYGSLFTTPNPPSRVTISCGDLLPTNSGNIAIYVTLRTGDVDRQGLHVQSRSYWAPANIGPYSQAISFPVTASGARVVHIAGQIPLVPASMELPSEGIEMQLVLSLQHLWRIGAEVGVQWWTGAAVYFPRAASSKSSLPAREKALLAWTAWRDAHLWSSSVNDDEGDNGPDLWDRKFNPLYMSYGGNSKKASLPDYSLLEEEDEKKPVPFFFAVEVDELPRSAEAEWHAHAGLVGVHTDTDTVRIYQERSEVATVEHCVLTSKAGGVLHSVVAVEVPNNEPADGQRSLEDHVHEASDLFRECLTKLTGEGGVLPTPYLVYVNKGIFQHEQISEAMAQGLSIIPCATIYEGQRGVGLELVALYRMDVISGK